MHILRVAIVIVSLLSVQGCAAVVLTAGGVAVGVGVNYTLNSNAYKTFTSPVADLRMATLKTLNRMGMKVTQDHKTASGWKIVATAKDRKIEIELESLTPKTTRMRVVAHKGEIFFKDGATATEIIVQTWQAIRVPAVGSLARTEIIITTGSGEQEVVRNRASGRQVGSSANGNAATKKHYGGAHKSKAHGVGRDIQVTAGQGTHGPVAIGHGAGALRPLFKSDCLPQEQLKAGLIMDVAKKYLREHPEKRHTSGSVLVTVALREAFPCK